MNNIRIQTGVAETTRYSGAKILYNCLYLAVLSLGKRNFGHYLPQSPCTLCVSGCGCGGRRMQYHNYVRFNVHILVDLVKRGVLILVGEIRRNRNARYYYYFILFYF